MSVFCLTIVSRLLLLAKRDVFLLIGFVKFENQLPWRYLDASWMSRFKLY